MNDISNTHPPQSKIISVLLAVSLAFLLAGCDRTDPQRNKTSSGSKSVQSVHYRHLLDIYNSFSYAWGELDRGVPPLLLRRFPTDMHLIRPVQAKKNFFFQSILPMALLGNQEIRQQREFVENLLALHDQGRTIALHQHEELIKIQRYYKVKGDVLNDLSVRRKLLKRIDIIPPALTLAQAANESGWGMSRFAQHANNIFGEWTFTPGTGLVPEGRPKGETYEVKRFDTLYASIRSYLRNLNTHSAYRSMRNQRLKLREKGLPLTGYNLAGEMRFYSTRRDAYVAEIRQMIRGNHLEKLNKITLLPQARKPEPAPEARKGGLMSEKGKASRQSKS